ncbi:hypothetical protein Tco_0925325 [Tanacetum coccineum]|uniref:CCHC-type domain-containing protein n=1 Tax=Tanacetum coccineum TaxID=301880 RepID=A0ABQ5D9H1_9ASTR
MECSSCGALYNKSCGCSKGSLVDKIVCDPNKTPDSSQRPPQDCVKCGNLAEDLLNTYESSDDDTNVVNAPREPFVVKQDPDENSSQSPQQINHNCCYECGDSLDGIFCQQCTCKSCGKGAHIGYNCPPKAPIIFNPEPCNQTIDELPQTLPSFDLTCYSEKENSLPYISKHNFVDDSPNVFNLPPQPSMYSCEFCWNDARYGHYYCGGPHETFQCQPMNYYKPNPCYDSNYSSFDQPQPPQYTVNHPIFNAQNDLFNSQNKLLEQMTSVCDMVGQIMQKKEEDKRIAEDQAAKDQYWKIPICYNDDDDEYSFATQEYLKKFSSAITPDLPKSDCLIMEDEHLDTISGTESDELIKSSVEDLVYTPSESDGISEGECDLPIYDDFSPKKDEVLDDIISIPPGNGNDHFNAESSLIEPVLNRDNVISSPKIDFLIKEFAGELDLIAPIPPGISDDDSYENIDYVDASPPDSLIVSLEVVEIVIPEVRGIDDDILLTIKDDILREKLSKINLLIAKIEALKDNPVPSSDFVTKSPSTFPNLFLEETNTVDNSLPESETFRFNLEEISSGSTTTCFDYSLPDYEVFYDDHIKEKSSGNTTTHSDFSLSKYDSFIFDLSIKLFPPADRSDFYHEEFADELAHIISPPKYDCFYFKNEPKLGNFTMDVVGDIFPTREPRVHVPNVLPTHPTLHQDLDFILSSDSLFAYIDCPDFEASRAHGFVLRSLELQILSFIWEIQYPNLIN